MISVIMGVYNTKNLELLKKSIYSILNQTYKDIELIICDDCSTDKNIDNILSFFSNNYSNVKIIKNKTNMGLAYSLNQCIKISKGEYIARQDDDDISFEDRLQKELDFLLDKKVDLVGCNINLMNDLVLWGQRKHIDYPTKKDLLRGPVFCHPAILVTKKSLLAVGGYTVNKYTRLCEDYDLYMKLYAKGFVGLNLQLVLYNYTQNIFTLKKRKFIDRLYEMRVRIYGFRKLKLLFFGLPFVFKPIVSFFVPSIFKKNSKNFGFFYNNGKSRFYKEIKNKLS